MSSNRQSSPYLGKSKRTDSSSKRPSKSLKAIKDQTSVHQSPFNPTITHNSSSGSGVITNQLPTLNKLDPTQFESWTKEEVHSLLCSAKGQGGAGLTVEKVKPLYDAGFDGNYIANIVTTIKKKDEFFALQELERQYINAGIPLTVELSNTLKTFVNWVENAILTPLKRDNDLLKKIGELAESNIEQCKALYAQANDTLLQETPNRALEMSYWPKFKQELMNSTTIPKSNVMFGFPDFGKEFKSCRLPLFGLRNEKFAKHELPYFSQFHYSMEKDQELLDELDSNHRNAIVFMGPSGVGKTSAAIRLLCKNPGMILTCTDFGETSSGLTTDSLMKHMHGYLLRKSLYGLYGCVEQVTQITIICRLIYILKLIQNAKLNPSVFKTFGGILPYLAYMQSNGKTSTSIEAFSMFVEFDLTPTATLIEIARVLTTEIIVSLNNFTPFGMKKKCEYFIVVLDEANVYARLNDHSKLSHLIGLGGKKRGLLTILTQVIAKNDIFRMSLFCGTNFSVDVGAIIQSALGKTEAQINIEKYYDFGLVAIEDLVSFLRQHIKITKVEQTNLELYLYHNDYKYFRRRIITLALEKLENKKGRNGQKLVTAFKTSIDTCLQYVCDTMMYDYFTAFTSITLTNRPDLTQHLQRGIIDAIVNYIAHYRFPFLGDEFTIENNDVADALLYSAFSGPEKCVNNLFTFSSKDFLGVEIGKILLDLITNKKTYNKEQKLPKLSDQENEQMMKYVISSKIKLALKSDHSIDMEGILLLRLAELNGLKLHKIEFLNQLTKNHTNLKRHKFKGIHFLKPDNYLAYCRKKRIDISKYNNGEMLYWTHFSEKKWDLLDGVFLTLSNYNHSEFFGINKVEGEDKIITFAAQSKVKSGKNFDIHESFKTTLHQLFYMDNYQDIPSSVTTNFNGCTLEKVKDKKKKGSADKFCVKKDGTKITDDILKINASTKNYGEIRDAVQQVFTDCAYSFHLCVGLHPTRTFKDAQKQTYLKNYLCAFIDKENQKELFGESYQTEVNNYLQRCADKISHDNKQ